MRKLLLLALLLALLTCTVGCSKNSVSSNNGEVTEGPGDLPGAKK